MPFWNKNALPPELRDLPAEEIAKRMKEGSEAAQKVKELEAAQTEANKTADELKAKIAEMEKKISETPTAGEGGEEKTPTVPQGDPTLTEWLSDPNASVKRAIAPLATATMVAGTLAAKRAAADFIATQGPVERKLWAKYEKEVQAFVDQLPPEQKIFPQTWINQFTFVKGMHLNDVVKEAQGAGEGFFAESSTLSGAGITDSQPKTKPLTDAELKVAKAMNISPEKYQERKKALGI